MHDVAYNKQFQGHPDDELLHALEPDQISSAASRPLGRYPLSRWGSALLWVLRIFVLIIISLAVYTFVVSLQ